VFTATVAACASSHHSLAYSGRLYSVAQVQKAFAALGLELHREGTHAGRVVLLNNRRLGPQRLPSPPRVVTVVVRTRRRPAPDVTLSQQDHHASMTTYANVTAVSKPYVVDEVRGAISALRWGTGSHAGTPARRLIVLADSISGIRLGERREEVEKTFGPGRSTRRGLVRYFGGHLLVDYWFHDRLYKRVAYLQTQWGGYHTRSGVHVGSTRRELRRLYVTCDSNTECHLLAGPWPDALATGFVMRHGRVAEIGIGYS
jgi:hypothetical protein